MSPKIHTNRAMRNIADVVDQVRDDTARWYKVNWIIVHTSHDICQRKGRLGHVKRQVIRRRLWRTAKSIHPVLRRYSIPIEISGDSPCRIKSGYKIKDKPSPPKTPIKPPTIYYPKNIPALIAAIITGIFIVFVPIIERKTIYQNISQFLTYFNLESLSSVLIIISVILVMVIFCLFLLNGLGIKPNRYSKYAGYLSILYFSLIFLENMFFIKNTNQISVSGITLISYWIAAFGVASIGIVYLIFFETVDWNKKNRWKIVTFTITCGITLFSIGIVMPVILSSTGSLITANFEGQSYSVNSKYHVGEVATDNNGQQGFAIISDDGQGHYTIVPVFLDYSQKGWHTNGKVDPQIVTYQSVEQRYPVEWAGGRMDISHIPDRDWTYSPSTGSSSSNVIPTLPITKIPTPTQKTIGTTVPITEIVNRHNYYRSSVTGANIPNLIWSPTLANSAQSWANYLGANNLFEHSGGPSENLAAGQPSWTSAIDAWGIEKSHFIYAPFGNEASNTGYWGDVGHYTQVIWKTTTDCGCGCAPHPTYGTVYVCQYAPAGNIVGYYPY